MNILNASDDDLLDLYTTSMKHCANVVLTNVDGSDDAQDYTESATEIMFRLNSAYRESDTEGLRDEFGKILNAANDDYDNHPYLAFASDAVPSEWDEYITNNLEE